MSTKKRSQWLFEKNVNFFEEFSKLGVEEIKRRQKEERKLSTNENYG